MWWRRGWFLKTLNYLIEKDLRETFYQNQTYLDNKWNLKERQVLQWGLHPKGYTFGLCIAFVLHICNSCLWLDKILPFIPNWQQPWDNILQWQKAILGGQLTIIGLIFPLAIGFVGIKLERNSASRALWQIYRSYSGLMFVGLSGLSLGGVIVLIQYIHPWFPHSTDILFSIGICLWFLFNLAMSGWFLVTTFQFMDSDFRSKLIMKYCINETLLDDIRVRLSEIIPTQAKHYKLFGKLGGDNEVIEITTHYFSKDTDDNSFVIPFSHEKYLKNICFRIIHFVIWLRHLFCKKSSTQTKNALCFPVAGKKYSYKDLTLAISSGFSLTKPEKILIRQAYSFTSTPGNKLLDLDQVVNLFVGGIEDTIRDNNIRQFKIAIEEMIQWHSNIMDVSSFDNDFGNLDNWILLPDGSFWGQSILREISIEYYKISRLIIQQLPVDREYFNILCRLHLRIHRFQNNKLPRKVVLQILDNHYYVWQFLLDWHNNENGLNTNSISEQNYNYALQTYVGQWENWLDYLPPIEEISWDNVQDRIAPFVHHLISTARFIITALRHHENEAATWAIDMLLYWDEKISSNSNRHFDSYLWRNDFITHTLLGEDPSSQAWTYILNTQKFDKQEAIYCALKNSWVDIRIVVACYILGKHQLSTNNAYIQQISSLLNGIRPKPNNDNRPVNPIKTGFEILKTYMRNQWYWRQGGQNYGSWLSDTVESFSEIDKERMVSGRSYSGWGSHSIQSSYIILAISLSKEEWRIPQRFYDDMFIEPWEQTHREQFIDDLERWLNPTSDILEKVALISKDKCCDLVDNFKNSVKSIIDKIKEKNTTIVIEAEEDQDRLDAYGRNASHTAFSANPQNLLFSLFANIELIKSLPDSCKGQVFISNFDKKDIAKGIDVDRGISEDQWLAEIVNQRVSENLFRRLFKEKKYIETDFQNIRELLASVVTTAQKIIEAGQTPILFIGPSEIEKVLQKSIWNRLDDSEELPFNIRKNDGYPDQYICHLEQIEVYHAPFRDMDFCALIPRECLDTIKVRQFENSGCLDTKFNGNDENGNAQPKGRLELFYWVECVFSRDQTWKFKLISNDS